ncbi:hypothetical protein ATCC90586_005610 [Pythium insidiosum]|nr:hypothetical protein ATCC90586_005610 [Pythium insidiosum]
MTTAFIGFAVLIPAEYPDDEVVANLDDISETASTLTFLIQIVIIGRDVTKKVKIRSLRLMKLCAKLLILIEFACIVLALLSIIHPRIGMSWKPFYKTQMTAAADVDTLLSSCLPFSLFQYLVVTYYRRRKEWRVKLLIFIAFLACAVIVPFPHPNRDLYMHLEDTSEVCSTLTFLVQIVIIGRDLDGRPQDRTFVAMVHFGPGFPADHIEVCAAATYGMLLQGEKHWELRRGDDTEVVRIVRHRGDTVYVPPGWVHNVTTVSDGAIIVGQTKVVTG